MYQDLYDVISLEGFDYDEYWKGEEEIITPRLQEKGYENISFHDGERDSFGPLTRIVKATVGFSGPEVEFIYG